MGLDKERIAQLVYGLFGLSGGQVSGLLQRSAGIGALQEMDLGLASDVFFDPRRHPVAARCGNRFWEYPTLFVQNGIRGFRCGFAKEAGEEGHEGTLKLGVLSGRNTVRQVGSYAYAFS